MKATSIKYISLLLGSIWTLHTYAVGDSHAHNLHVGIEGGVTLNLASLENLNAILGGAGGVALDYIYYASFNGVEHGLKTGVGFGYNYTPDTYCFAQSFDNTDYLGNLMEYTTSGTVEIQRHLIYASIPLMYALRTNGFVCNVGARLQTYIVQKGSQTLINPSIQAYYPKYDVLVSNELITGLLTEEQLYAPLSSMPLTLECQLGMEIGYEHNITPSNAIGMMAYCNIGVWNSLSKGSNTNIIQVSPIVNAEYPVPTVTVNDVSNALLRLHIPMQCGIKLYYSFDF